MANRTFNPAVALVLIFPTSSCDKKETGKRRSLFSIQKNLKITRPRHAIEAIQAWAQGKRVLGMVEVRKLSLDSHAAAREANSDAARFVARAAGQAIATWHVPTHAVAVLVYANKALAAYKNKSVKKTKQSSSKEGQSIIT